MGRSTQHIKGEEDETDHLGHGCVRAGGQAYYDDVLDITWLADANYSQTSGYDNDGMMNWDQAQSWIGSLNAANHLDTNNWRLPLTVQPDASCSHHLPNGFDYGYHCTGSEMGHLYNVDGISYSSPGPFSNVDEYYNWSGTVDATNSSRAWVFGLNEGFEQNAGDKNAQLTAWAVRSGDIGVVPVPGAVWLLGSALGVMGVLKRRSLTATAA